MRDGGRRRVLSDVSRHDYAAGPSALIPCPTTTEWNATHPAGSRTQTSGDLSGFMIAQCSLSEPQADGKASFRERAYVARQLLSTTA